MGFWGRGGSVDRGVHVGLGSCSRGLISGSTRGVIGAIGTTNTAISNPVPLPARGHVFAIGHSAFMGGGSHRRFRLSYCGHLVSVCDSATGAISTLVGLRLPSNIRIRVGISWSARGGFLNRTRRTCPETGPRPLAVFGWVFLWGVPKLVKGGVKVASMFDTRNGDLPYAIVRMNPYIIARVGAMRGSNCTTLRLNFRSGGRGRAGGTRGKRFTTSNAAPGHGLIRFGKFRNRFGLNSTVAISVFRSKRFISIMNASGNGNRRNIMKHCNFNNINRAARNRRGHLHTPNSLNTSSCPSHMFGKVHVNKHANNSHMAVRDLGIVGIVPRRGLLLIGNSIPNTGNSVMLVRGWGKA